MTKIKNAQSGSFESSDIMILIEEVEEGTGRKIELSSTVMLQYGDKIKQIIDEKLDEYNISDIHLIAKDKGALDITIEARLETALKRALNQQKGVI